MNVSEMISLCNEYKKTYDKNDSEVKKESLKKEPEKLNLNEMHGRLYYYETALNHKGKFENKIRSTVIQYTNDNYLDMLDKDKEYYILKDEKLIPYDIKLLDKFFKKADKPKEPNKKEPYSNNEKIVKLRSVNRFGMFEESRYYNLETATPSDILGRIFLDNDNKIIAPDFEDEKTFYQLSDNLAVKVIKENDFGVFVYHFGYDFYKQLRKYKFVNKIEVKSRLNQDILNDFKTDNKGKENKKATN